MHRAYKLKFWLTLLVLGVLGIWGFASLIFNDFSSPPSWASTLDGTWISTVEDRFDDGLLFRTPIIETWNRGLFAILGQGLPGVLFGTQGWLFTEEEWYLDPAESSGAWVQIEAARENLESRGIELFVLLVPTKNRIAAEFSPFPIPTPLVDRYTLSLQRLEQLGILSIDLAQVYSRPLDPSLVFLRTDTHWTPEGARIAAQEIAQMTKEKRSYLGLGDWSFATVGSDREPLNGDLFEFLPRAEGTLRLGRLPLPDLVGRYSTSQVSGPVLGLFDVPRIPLALVGTSYSAGERWNFLGFLKEALGADIVSFAQEGKGPFLPMKEALENPGLEEAGVKLIVWEIPERYLPAKP